MLECVNWRCREEFRKPLYPVWNREIWVSRNFALVLPGMDARDRSRDNAVYEAENDQLIGRLIELERLTSVLRLIQTLIVLVEWLIPLLEDVRISRNNLDIIAMLKDNLLNLEAELQQRSWEVREQILSRYHRALRVHNKVGIAWIDNDSARYAILKGNSDSFSLRALCRVNQQIELEAPSSVWYERASSYSNPSDGPSRKLVSQTASLLGALDSDAWVTPDHLIQAIMDLHSKPLSLLYALTNGGQPPVRSVENSNSWSHPRSRKGIGVRLFIVHQHVQALFHFDEGVFHWLVFLNSELPRRFAYPRIYIYIHMYTYLGSV